MGDIRKLARLEVIVLVLFVALKLSRPTILASAAPEWLKIFSLSFPNLCEAIIGIMTLTMLGLLFKQRFLSPGKQLKEQSIYWLAAIFTTLYVTTQELKWHNLGGHNVYDPMDVLFSIIGVAIGLLLLFKIQPKVQPDN